MEVNGAIVMMLKPNARQRKMLAQHFGQQRFIYNYFLSKRQRDYKENKLRSSYFKDCRTLTVLKSDLPWLYEASTNSQQRTLKNLDDAFKRFFKGNGEYPRFKKKMAEQSFTARGKEIKVDANRLKITKFMEGIRFNRKVPSFKRILSVTVRQATAGHYYAAISVVFDKKPLPTTGKQTGIDLGLTDLAVFSTGKRIKAPKHFRRLQGQLKQAQQHLSRKVKGSKRRTKQRMKVAAIHRQIANARKDTLHKASAFAIKNHDVIAVESLAVSNMLKNRSLSKSISDAGWGEFVRQLEYKAKWYGRKVIKVGRFYPSSKACSGCGWIHQGLKLSDRVWNCQQCGMNHDRDLNAALNILSEALKSERQPSITGVEKKSVLKGLLSKRSLSKRLTKNKVVVQPSKEN